MNELFSSATFGLLLSLGSFQLARWFNQKAKREICNPLLFSSVFCILFLVLGNFSYEQYYVGARFLDYLLTPATICLAIPLYRQFALLKRNVPAVAAGCAAGVLAQMLCSGLMVLLFRLDSAQLATVLPKSITTAIGKSLSQELGGYPSITAGMIIITGIFGAVTAPFLLKLAKITHPLAQGLAIGTSAHAAGTSKAVELGDIQGAASSLAIVVAGLLTVVAAPITAALFS